MHNILSAVKEFIHISAMLNVSKVYIGLSYFFTLFTSIQNAISTSGFNNLDIWELLLFLWWTRHSSDIGSVYF